MKIEVTKNTKRNMIVGTANKVVLLILPFFVRSIIYNTLGSEYLGLNSLFTSILHVLSLSELGLSSALVYNMYKPIADNDNTKINALLNLYRKAYFAIGLFILTIGLIIIPILPHLIKGSYPTDTNIIVIYLIQLLNTTISYILFAYKQSLLVAYQREDKNYIINLVVNVCLQGTQIFLLKTTHNYYAYVICLPIFTVISNLWIGYITKRMFPFVKSEGKLDNRTLGSIKKLVIGTFIQKACSITRNSLDSICLSAFIGLSITAIYNNYYTVFNGLTMLLGVISTSLAGGVGNHVVIKTKEENFTELKRLDFLYMNISGWCAICLLCLYQPFMIIWMGDKMLLSSGAVILICLYFYILKTGDMRTIYSSANGLWWHHRYRSITETIMNTTLNIVLGILFGIYGIIAATIISLFICNFLWGSTIVFKQYFQDNRIKQYYLYHTKYFFVTCFVGALTYSICRIVNIESSILCLFVSGIICLIIPAICYFIIYYNSQICKDSLSMLHKHK